MRFLTTVFLTVALLESSTCRTGEESQENQVHRTAQREPQDTLPQMQATVPPSTFGLKFQKCAEVKTESEVLQVSFYLLVTNPARGVNLSQLRIRDTISDITLLQTSGNIQETGYQTFTTSSLHAGTSYEVRYTASVKGNKNDVLSLPAFLTFSNTAQNDINLLGPVVANFSLRLNATGKVCVNHALHLAGFCGALLLSTLLFSLTLFSTNYLYTHLYSPQHQRRRGLSGGVEPEGSMCNTSVSANEEAEFEDKFVDIIALENPQNMLPALDNLEMCTLLRGALWVEFVRVQMVRGVFGVLLGVAGAAGRRVVAVLLGQVTGMEGKLQEEQGGWLTSRHRTQTTENTHYGRVLEHAQQQEVVECRVLTEKLERLEGGWVQQALQARQDRASARAQRHTAVRRRAELHSIFTEELQEAARTGELDPDIANALLHQYYTCQNQLEAVLDLFVANQRAALREQQAHRQFLVQGLQDLQEALSHALRTSSHNIHRWFTEIRKEGVLSDQQCKEQLEHAQLELLRVKQVLEEMLTRQCSAAHCDIIKRRQARISETLCQQKREQQELEGVCEGPVDRYLCRWQILLSAHTTHYSELLTHLDQEAAGEIRKVVLAGLQEAGLELRAVTEGVARSLQALGVPRWLLQQDVGGDAVSEAQERLREQWRDAAAALRVARNCAHQRREEELQRQKCLRLRLEQFCGSVCGCQWALSEVELLRVRLACVKQACRTDQCLALSHAVARARLYSTLTDQPDLSTDHLDSCTTPPQTQKGSMGTECPTEATLCPAELGDGQSGKNLEERVEVLQQERERGRASSTVEEEEVCAREEEDEQVCLCEEGVGAEIAAVQWERAERRSRVLETHSALLTLQTLLLQHLRHTHIQAAQQLKHTLHKHCLALEEAELQQQKEESEWEEFAFGRGSHSIVSVYEEDEDNELFSVDKSCGLATNLQEALYKRQELTHTLTERLREAGRRQQVMVDLRDQLELKYLYTLCDQDLVLCAELVNICGVSVMVLQQILRLLLPTLPEGKLQSLTDTLSSKAGRTAGPCRELVDGLRSDIVRKNLLPCSQLTNRETDRLLKKKLKLVEKLFPSSAVSGKGGLKVSLQENPPPMTQLAAPGPLASTSLQAEEEPAVGAKPVMGGVMSEGMCPTNCKLGDEVGVAIESPMSGERLFISRPPLPDQEPDHFTEHPKHSLLPSLHSHRKRRNFLGFKKGSVAPEEQT